MAGSVELSMAGGTKSSYHEGMTTTQTTDLIRLPFRAAFLLIAALAAVHPALAEQPGARIPSFAPKVFRYDPKTDTLYHFRSVTNPVFRRRSGGEINFHGSRLRQFRYVGPREQSGIYGALDDHKARMHLDASNYKYRW